MAHDRRREFAVAIHRLRQEIADLRDTLSKPECGVHLNGRDIKFEIVSRFSRQLAELDWLTSQIIHGEDVNQDTSQEVQSLGDTDGLTVAHAGTDLKRG
jgi:hypothetical protein